MDWIEKLQEQFPQRNAIYIVKDIDGILLRETVIDLLKSKNINVLNFEDPVRFRFVFERYYRFARNKTLIIRIGNEDKKMVPWDVYEKAFQLVITFDQIFPGMDRMVIRNLPNEYLSAISRCDTQFSDKLNETETKKKVLMAVFGKKIFSIYEEREVDNILRKYWSQFEKPVPQLLQKSLQEILQRHVPVSKSLLVQFKSKGQYLYKPPAYHADLKLKLPNDYDESAFLRLGREIGLYRAFGMKHLEPINESRIKQINNHFQIWLREQYGGLPTKSSTQSPRMVHNIPSVLNRKTNGRLALIVMDGMSFSQWSIIENYLYQQGVESEVDATFSWIPSITSVSRQAIFSGAPPHQFSDSIHSTNKEEKKWKEFWEKQGLTSKEVVYKRSLGFKDINVKESNIGRPETKVFGGVIDVVDQFIHGARQGLNSVHSELRLWLKGGYLLDFLEALFQLNYDVYVTSDHGNIEAVGSQTIRQGVLSEVNGQRVRIYESDMLRARTVNGLEEDCSFEWDSHYLPGNYKPLIAKDYYAFIRKNEKVIVHGGTHIEEVVVPFVRVYRGVN
ncbi:BREX-3 system phosphatase PglZ [Atopococcus tabaci]|uniref:BREX-3 system phosphatase PglZ n=1 Tax=Atopococcus tabaci TaxID=269774 RepID=UPI0004193A3A|nr:BREX-3 system phosphatase PglZ [Atopococcus tabaci]